MLFKPVFGKKLRYNAVFALGLILLFGISRFFAVRYGIASGNNTYTSLIFGLMILAPFVLLSKKGRKHMGLARPRNPIWVLYAFIYGILMSLLVCVLGVLFFKKTVANWFVYIGESYPLDLATISGDDKIIYFAVFLLIGISFSPLGEEFLYRGMIHGSLANKFGQRGAALIDSAAFGLTHLAHFGIIYVSGIWEFLPVPAFLWVVLMFLTGLLFNFCKSRAGSIWGAVVSHMGFNVGMTYLIFYYLF